MGQVGTIVIRFGTGLPDLPRAACSTLIRNCSSRVAKTSSGRSRQPSGCAREARSGPGAWSGHWKAMRSPGYGAA
jgi:hypothetical protein